MDNTLNEAMRLAGIDTTTPVDTVFHLQCTSRAFLALDQEEEYAYDDMLERCAGGQPCFLTTSG